MSPAASRPGGSDCHLAGAAPPAQQHDASREQSRRQQRRQCQRRLPATLTRHLELHLHLACCRYRAHPPAIGARLDHLAVARSEARRHHSRSRFLQQQHHAVSGRREGHPDLLHAEREGVRHQQLPVSGRQRCRDGERVVPVSHRRRRELALTRGEVLDARRHRHRPHRRGAVPRHPRHVAAILQHDEVERAAPAALLRLPDHQVATGQRHRRRRRRVRHQHDQPGIGTLRCRARRAREVLDAVVKRAGEEQRGGVRGHAELEAAGGIGQHRVHRTLLRRGEPVQHHARSRQWHGIARGQACHRAAHARLCCHARRRQQPRREQGQRKATG